jgi:hypothetical protein
MSSIKKQNRRRSIVTTSNQRRRSMSEAKSKKLTNKRRQSMITLNLKTKNTKKTKKTKSQITELTREQRIKNLMHQFKFSKDNATELINTVNNAQTRSRNNTSIFKNKLTNTQLFKFFGINN